MSEMKYKGYIGSHEVSIEDGVIFGKLLHIRDLVTYESETVAGIQAAFQNAVDDYLVDCEQDGRDPDTPFKGVFNVRVSSDLHRDLASSASRAGMTFNRYVSLVLAEHSGCLGVHGPRLKRGWAEKILNVTQTSKPVRYVPVEHSAHQSRAGEGRRGQYAIISKNLTRAH